MRVLQCPKRSVTLLAAVCVAVNACGGSGPEVPFNPAGTSDDILAMNETFASPVFASFSTFSLYFDAAIEPAPMVSAAARAFNFRRATTRGELKAAALRTAQRLAALMPSRVNGNFSASSAAIPAEVAGKTFEFNGGSYVPTERQGAPANGVRFLIYAINPVTLEPADPLQEVGYVQLTDLSGGSTQAARVVVVSGGTTYLDYAVSATATATSGQVTVSGYVTDGVNRANILLRTTISEAGGLTLLYSLDVPQRDVSIDLTMTLTGFDTENGTIGISLSMSGPNGSVSLSGELTETGGTLTARVNGDVFATISTSGTQTVITGADGQPLSEEDAGALENIFNLTGGAFAAFDAMIVPVGTFLAPA